MGILCSNPILDNYDSNIHKLILMHINSFYTEFSLVEETHTEVKQ